MKAYIVRLEENKHSCKMAKDCFEQAVKHKLSPQYFKAINGKDWGKHFTATGLTPFRKFKKGRLGVLGCFFSHYYIWREILSSKEPAVVLEHDGYVIRDIDDSILDTFIHILKLDRLDPYKKNYNTLIEKEKYLDIRVEKYVNLSPKNPEKLKTGNYFKGAYSYILKPEGAELLINWVHEKGFLPADQQIGDWVLDTKTTIPTLARLHPWYSIGNNINTGSLTQGLENNI